jgi:ankyrin repeat protein
MQSTHAQLQFSKGTRAINEHFLNFLQALDVKAVEDALVAGADVNMHMGALGLTPLMYCARNCAFDPALDVFRQRSAQLDILKLLLERGAKVNDVNKQGNSALHYALVTEFDAAAEVLMRRGASLNSVNHKGVKTMELCNSINTPMAFHYMMRELLHMEVIMWDDLVDQL